MSQRKKSPSPDNWSAYTSVAFGLAIAILYAMKYPSLVTFEYIVILIGLIMALSGGYKIIRNRKG